MHPVFNEGLLQPWNPPTHEIQKRNERPPPEILEEAEEYEVEDILDERLNKRRKRKEWLVKWKGYPSEENTWEPEQNLKNAKGALDAFNSSRGRSPRGEDDVMMAESTTAPSHQNDTRPSGKSRVTHRIGPDSENSQTPTKA